MSAPKVRISPEIGSGLMSLFNFLDVSRKFEGSTGSGMDLAVSVSVSSQVDPRLMLFS